MSLDNWKVDILVCVSCLSLSALLFLTSSDDASSSAYILSGSVTHARLIPQRSQHAFTYPMLTFLFSLSDLEAGKLSLARGWLFSYGGIFFRALGLRATNYLYDDYGKETSIRTKLVKTLEKFGFSGAAQLSGVWMMTMPSYFGWEGINPLSVYFCHKRDKDALWLVVFEVHNTFGERHIYVVETDVNEETPPKGFDYQWTLPRSFHVSPFNDRSGVYTFAIRALPSPPFSSSSSRTSTTIKPVVRIDFHDCPPNWMKDKEKGPLKLRAAYRTTQSMPFSTPTLLRALAVHPLTLSLGMPRTLYQALLLHYKRHLPVHPRPEMKPTAPHWGSQTEPPPPQAAGGVAWQRPTLLESLVERLVLRFIARRAAEANVSLTLQAGDGAVPPRTFTPSPQREMKPRTLGISHLSPRLFTMLLLAPDARSALARGGPQAQKGGEVAEFVVSDTGLFCDVFTRPARAGVPWGVGMLRYLRRLRWGWGLGEEDEGGYLEPNGSAEMVGYLVVVGFSVAMDWLGEIVWRKAGVRFAGQDDGMAA